jgi:predicted dehydrogenase
VVNVGGPVRWGILGTASVASLQFLPGLRAAGGIPAAVAGRGPTSAEKFAAEHGVQRAVAGYESLVDDPGIDAIYIPLPLALHAEWTIRALEAGKPTLCEKPLCGTLSDTERVLAAAQQSGTLLWEAFIFPFHRQMRAIEELIADGAIGELIEIKSNFHRAIRGPANIRLSRELQGGALRDIGCYPVRLAQLLFGTGHQDAWARATMGGDGVDVDTWGVLGYPGGRRLVLSAGMNRSYDTFTSLEGTAGQIRITNPFDPGPSDTYQVVRAGAEPRTFPATAGEPSLTPAIAHINAVISENVTPLRLATQTSLVTARALDDLAASFSAAAPGSSA